MPSDEQRPVLVVGSGVIDAGMGDVVVATVERHRIGVLNTYCAKGLFAFDHPAHLGTVGLQHRDLALASVTGPDALFAPVIAVGLAAGELHGGLPESFRVIEPNHLASLDLPVAATYPDRPPLYGALAQVCGPLYADETIPLSPVRAAGDLSAWLPDRTVVVAGAGLAGFWIGRTFPTRRPATVWLPAGQDPGFVDRTVARQVGLGNTVVVVTGPGDPGVSPGVVPAGASVIVEHWAPDGPGVDPVSRLTQLDDAVHRARHTASSHPHGAQRAGASEHLTIGVCVDDLTGVEAIAGPVTAWGGVPGR